MDLSDVFIILTRLFLETISYYNAKIMYSYKGMSKVSPILTLYLTHSMGTILFLRDLYKYKGNYLNKITMDTGIKAKEFIVSVAWLSLFYNLCHIPKFYAMNYLTDVSIVTIYGASVLFTYVFSIAALETIIDKEGLVSLAMGIIGVFLLLLGDKSIGYHSIMCVVLFVSSLFSGMYAVLFKKAMVPHKSVLDKIDELSQAKQLSDEIIENKSNEIVFNTETENKKITGEQANLDFYSIETKDEITADTSIDKIVDRSEKVKYENDTENQNYFYKKELSRETKRRINFMRHYMSLTGLLTLLLYWPGLVFVHHMKIEPIHIPFQILPLFHVFIANTISLVHNVIYFIIICSRSPLFAQISGIILQPTFLFIQIVRDNGMAHFFELIGCGMSFVSFIILSSVH